MAKEMSLKNIEHSLKSTKLEDNLESLIDFRTSNINYFSTLPNELVLYIFRFLDDETLAASAAVSSKWKQLASISVFNRGVILENYDYKKQIEIFDSLNEQKTPVKKFQYILDFRHGEDIFFIGSYLLYEQDCGVQRGVVLSNKLIKFLQRNCQTLTQLNIRYLVNDDTLAEIGNCKNLTKLSLSHTTHGCYVTDGYTCLSRLNNLVSLYMYDLHIEQEDLIGLLQANPSLKHLTMIRCHYIKKLEDIVAEILKNNPKIKTLHFKGTGILSERCVELFSKFHSLEALGLPRWEDPSIIKKIALGCLNLKIFHIHNFHNLNEKAMLPMFKYMKNLTELDVCHSRIISKDLCTKILANLTKLRKVNFYDCGTSDLNVEELKAMYPDVQFEKNSSIYLYKKSNFKF